MTRTPVAATALRGRAKCVEWPDGVEGTMLPLHAPPLSAGCPTLSNRNPPGPYLWRLPRKARASVRSRGWLGANAAALLAILAGTSCLTGVEPGAVNSTPYIKEVAPATVALSSAGLSLTVRGERFVDGAEARWKGETRTARVDSPTELTVSLLPRDLDQPGAFPIVIENPSPGGGDSNEVLVTVQTLVPTIDSLNPRQVESAEGEITVRIFGTGFTDFAGGTRVVIQRDVSVAAEFVSTSEVRAVLTDDVLLLPGSLEIAVVNPPPGGGKSPSLPFVAVKPVPVLTSVEPDRILIGEPTQLVLRGSGFLTDGRLWLDSVSYAPTSMNPGRATFIVPGGGVVRDGGGVRFENAAPGGGFSNEVTLLIRERRPEVREAEPATLSLGGGDQEVLVIGDDLAPDAVVTVDGVPLAATPVDARTLRIVVPAARTAAFGTLELRVENPREGGLSNELEVPVIPDGELSVVRLVARTTVRGMRLDGTERYRIDVGMIPRMIDTAPFGDTVVLANPALSIMVPGEGVRVLRNESSVQPRWSNDGWIYFGEHDLYRIRPDGSNLEEIISGVPPGVWNRWPEPSPDGTRLLFSRYPTDTIGTAVVGDDLKLLDLATGLYTSVGVPAHDSRWSPDAQWIAYRRPNGVMAIVRPDGTGDRVVFNGRRTEAGFDWSPDGTMLIAAVQGLLQLFELSTGTIVSLPRGPVNALSVSWLANPG